MTIKINILNKRIQIKQIVREITFILQFHCPCFQEDEFTRLERRNSTFTPREGQFEAVDKFIDKCRKDIAVTELS